MGSLTIIIFFPILIGLALTAGAKSLANVAKLTAVVAMLFTLGIAVGLIAKMDETRPGFQFIESMTWIPELGTKYLLGIDGISSWMVLLTGFLGLIAVLVSRPTDRQASFYGQLLILSGVLIGVFCALDLVLFYILFELSLVPVALLILGWGRGDRQLAATRYLAMLFGGSLLMLFGIICLVAQYHSVTSVWSTSIFDIQSAASDGTLWRGKEGLESLAFWGFLIAFLIKSPAIPGHSWLASTYQSAPVGATIAGVVLKVGTYGLFRFCLPLFPNAAVANAPFVIFLGVVGIVYGGVLAINQKNIFRVMAFSTISHVGFILIGLFSFTHTGMMGAAFQQFNHGLASAAVFVLVAFLMDRGFSGEFSELGGLKKSMPLLATLFMVAMLANLGLPLTSGFVGEILALMGTFEAGFAGIMGLNVSYAAVAGTGAILSAAYMLYAYQKMFYGPEQATRQVKDLNFQELLLGGVFTVALLVGGILPTTVLKRMEPSVAFTGLAVNPDFYVKWQGDPTSVPPSRLYVATQNSERGGK